MSQQLINHSPDLKKLRDEGFKLEIQDSYLLIHDVPYVNSKKEVAVGKIVSKLTLLGDRTAKPETHVAFFVGEYPCHNDGRPINQIKHNSNDQQLSKGLTVNHSFSNKPKNGYADFYEKMTTYVKIISHPAQSVDSSLTAKTFNVIESDDEESVFKYVDTNSSRAEINVISEKLRKHKIGIVGLGGTGSYILDLVSKTPVKEIHLFDGDDVNQHNAFRTPGAISIEKLRAKIKKTDYLKEAYSNMHKHIYSHADFINSFNVDQLSEMEFVFICVDIGEAKKLLIKYLLEKKISFIDVGIGLLTVDDKLLGSVRITSCTENKRDHIGNRISFVDDTKDEYSTNIQIADLNMFNAALAVIKWKKICGFYQDLLRENHTVYSINDNCLQGEDNDS